MSKKGIYVAMAHHPQVILDAMAGLEGAVSGAIMQQKLLRIAAVAVFALAILSWLPGFLLLEQSDGSSICVPFVLMPVGIVVVVVIASVRRRLGNPLLQEHFQSARQILYTLRDDTGRKGRVVGWLDLSRPQQKEKIVRSTATYSGKRKVYYRHPWFKVKFKLADGNVLRLTLEDKVKTKAGSAAQHSTQFGAKLVVNPNLYRPGKVPGSAVPLGTTLTHEDGVFVVKAPNLVKNLWVPEVLGTLKAVYSHLEPISSELPLAHTTATTEV